MNFWKWPHRTQSTPVTCAGLVSILERCSAKGMILRDRAGRSKSFKRSTAKVWVSRMGKLLSWDARVRETPAAPFVHQHDMAHSWWRHQMETFSPQLAICAGNSPVTGEFPAQGPVTRSFEVFFDLHPNKRLSKQSWGCWFETPSSSLWRHCNVTRILYYITRAFFTNIVWLQSQYWEIIISIIMYEMELQIIHPQTAPVHQSKFGNG